MVINTKKFRYFRLSVLLLATALFNFTESVTKLPFSNFNLEKILIDKISTLTLLFSAVTYYYFHNNLKVKIFNFIHNKPELIPSI